MIYTFISRVIENTIDITELLNSALFSDETKQGGKVDGLTDATSLPEITVISPTATR